MSYMMQNGPFLQNHQNKLIGASNDHDSKCVRFVCACGMFYIPIMMSLDQ